ncbi:MAG: DUF4395 domain-containing protein [Acidimicrobiia bacterium]
MTAPHDLQPRGPRWRRGPLDAPRPIDARGPRFTQSVLAVVLLAGFVFHGDIVIPVLAVVLFPAAAFGPSFDPLQALFRFVIAPRLGPTTEMQDPRPQRFTAALGVAFLAVATVALAVGLVAVAWVFALVVATTAALSATTGICVACEIYLRLRDRRVE